MSRYVSDELFGSVAFDATGHVIASAQATRNSSVKRRFICYLLLLSPELRILPTSTVPCKGFAKPLETSRRGSFVLLRSPRSKTQG